MVLDEASASLDTQSDVHIQRVMRELFQDDVTCITVAHRLNTIIDSDRVLVLDKGEVSGEEKMTALFCVENKIARLLKLKGHPSCCKVRVVLRVWFAIQVLSLQSICIWLHKKLYLDFCKQKWMIMMMRKFLVIGIWLKFLWFKQRTK